MALFTNEDFGIPIDKELSEYLQKYVSRKEHAEVSYKTGIGVSTISYVVARSNTLTKRNHIAIIKLIEVALKNSIKRQRECEREVIYFEDLLNEENNDNN